MRKYFYFGDLLEPTYRQRMFAGGQQWTARDPLHREHYAYSGPKAGWGPDAKNSWVDVRSTENLWLMRTTSVYLMAEETGNTHTAAIYRDRLLNYTKTLYRVGIGEWDSENYHGHSIAPLLNLYDFAKDVEVKAAAKACLDFFTAAGAVKYWRGGFNGPSKRDYNHAQPFGGSAANSLWMWFGDHPQGKQDRWEADEVHQITSAYRPPLAVVYLARKRFPKPIEIFAAKPAYDATTGFRHLSRPKYFETQYVANSYQLGSLTGGTSTDGGDVNGFKLLAYDQHDGAVALHAIPGNNPLFPGSPMYKDGVVANQNRVAQFENLAIWLVKDGNSPWLWVIPDEFEVSHQAGVTFLKGDRTWVGVRPIGTSQLDRDPDLTQRLNASKKNRFPGHQVLSCQGQADVYCGLSIEVGEQESHGTFSDFKSAVLNAKLDIERLDRGEVAYTSSSDKSLRIAWDDDPLKLGVWRDGQPMSWKDFCLYDSPVITAEWGAGNLQVNTPEAQFGCSVSKTGAVTFE